MALICEDLAPYGVVLIPPVSQEYFDLLADIEHRLQGRTGGPPLLPGALSRISEHDTAGSAILVNRANVAIASLAYTWTFRDAKGRTPTSNRLPGTNPSVLLPFLQQDRTKKFDAYWNTIFPGSKRLMTADGATYGDNMDVRPPAADEQSRGGFAVGFGSGGGNRASKEPVKLTLDGVFFVDGGFAGPNRLGSWDQLVAARETFLDFAARARAANTPAAQSDFFAYAQMLSGLTGNEPQRGTLPIPPPPPPPPPPLGGASPDSMRQYEQQRIARTVLGMRDSQGASAALATIAAWQNTTSPEPHKL